MTELILSPRYYQLATKWIAAVWNREAVNIAPSQIVAIMNIYAVSRSG